MRRAGIDDANLGGHNTLMAWTFERCKEIPVCKNFRLEEATLDGLEHGSRQLLRHARADRAAFDACRARERVDGDVPSIARDSFHTILFYHSGGPYPPDAVRGDPIALLRRGCRRRFAAVWV